MEACYVLHRRKYRDSSLLLDVFSYRFGRVNLIAKGSYKKGSAASPLLQPFQPLLLQWSGKSDLKTLTKLEAPTRAISLAGMELYTGMYANEILYRLLPLQQSSPEVFEFYVELLLSLSQNDDIVESVRLFELRLLSSLGMLADFFSDWRGQKIAPELNYYLSEDSNYVPCGDGAVKETYLGKDLLELGRLSQRSVQVSETHTKYHEEAELLRQKHVRRLLSRALDVALDGVELKSRALLSEFLKIKGNRS